MLVDSYKIEEILPCLADPEKIRVIASLSDDASEVMPYINSIIKNAIYIKSANAITIPQGEKLITIHPRKIAITRVDDEKEAKKILDKILKLINDTYGKRNDIEPNYERREKPKVMDIYKLLPQNNCRKCGELTCLAFAVKITEGKASILRCSKLFQAEFSRKRAQILELLQKAGFEIPSAFR